MSIVLVPVYGRVWNNRELTCQIGFVRRKCCHTICAHFIWHQLKQLKALHFFYFKNNRAIIRQKELVLFVDLERITSWKFPVMTGRQWILCSAFRQLNGNVWLVWLCRGKMIPSELERLICEHFERGNHPFFVNCTCGTTVLGAFDPIHPIADICEKYNLWLHVDVSDTRHSFTSHPFWASVGCMGWWMSTFLQTATQIGWHWTCRLCHLESSQTDGNPASVFHRAFQRGCQFQVAIWVSFFTVLILFPGSVDWN